MSRRTDRQLAHRLGRRTPRRRRRSGRSTRRPAPSSTPRTGRPDPAEVDQAAALAAEAFPAYRRTTAEQRAAFLDSIAANIEALGSALAERVTAETGLPAGRVAGETARTVGQLRLFATVVRDGGWHGVRVDTPLPDRTPLPRPDLRQRSVPVGPVAVFGASNFPLAFSVAGGDTASALAAGCPVVVKGHPAHPGTSELVGRAIRDGRGRARPAGGHLLRCCRAPPTSWARPWSPTRASRPSASPARVGGGLALVAAAQQRPEPIPVYAEMSSVNPVFLLPRGPGGAGGRDGVGVRDVGDRLGRAAVHPARTGLRPGEPRRPTRSSTRRPQKIADVVATPMLTAGMADALRSGRRGDRRHARGAPPPAPANPTTRWPTRVCRSCSSPTATPSSPRPSWPGRCSDPPPWWSGCATPSNCGRSSTAWRVS